MSSLECNLSRLAEGRLDTNRTRIKISPSPENALNITSSIEDREGGGIQDRERGGGMDGRGWGGKCKRNSLEYFYCLGGGGGRERERIEEEEKKKKSTQKPCLQSVSQNTTNSLKTLSAGRRNRTRFFLGKRI